MALTAATKTPKLLECSPPSMMQALMHCAELGLEPGGALGHIYLIPRGGEVQAQVGYKGLAELARRSGQIARIGAGVVYRAEIEAGTFKARHEPPSIEHTIDVDLDVDDDPSNLVLAYCVVETTDGGRYQSIVGHRRIARAKKASSTAGKSSSPWATDTAAMWRKTAILDLLNGGLVPLSTELSRALEVEREAERAVIDAGDVHLGSEDDPPMHRGGSFNAPPAIEDTGERDAIEAESTRQTQAQREPEPVRQARPEPAPADNAGNNGMF